MLYLLRMYSWNAIIVLFLALNEPTKKNNLNVIIYY